MAHIMDSETFETFESTIPDELKEDAKAGKEVDYVVAMGRKMLTRIY